MKIDLSSTLISLRKKNKFTQIEIANYLSGFELKHIILSKYMPFSSQTNLEKILKLFLKSSSIKVTSGSVKNCLKSHTQYLSLLSISECLSKWDIPNKAYNIKDKNYNASQFSFPLLAYTPAINEPITLVHSIENGIVEYSNSHRRNGTMHEEEFVKIWSGIVLNAVPTKSSGQTDYYSAYIMDLLTSIRIPAFVIIFFAILILVANTIQITLLSFLLLLLKFSGISITILLLIHTIDSKNQFVKSICKINKSDCDTILNSDASKLFSWLSWSEVGFFYFAGSFASALLVTNSLHILSVINLLCLPYSVFSIVYQYRKKNWCIFCVTIQVIFWLEFFVFLSLDSLNFKFNQFDFFTIGLTSLLFSFFFVSWLILKPILIKSNQHEQLVRKLNRFKYNEDLFQGLLTKQKYYPIPDDLNPIVLGNPHSKNVLTIISNPFCGPCRKIHHFIEKWLSTPLDLKIQIVFYISDSDTNDKLKLIEHFIYLHLYQDIKLAEEIMHDWFSGKIKLDSIYSKYSITKSDKEVLSTMQKQKIWYAETGFTATPTILINGYFLPDLYELEDIKEMIIN